MQDYWKFIALLLCVPFQLWLSSTTAPSDVNNARTFASGWTQNGGTGWWTEGIAFLSERVKLLAKIQKRLSQRQNGGKHSSSKINELDVGVSEAKEVFRLEYFSGGRAPRTKRDAVRYRVGQVFKHKVHGYKGLIVGWDLSGKAPDEWFKRMGVADLDREKPMYSVLVDARDRDQEHSRTYVIEGNIVLLNDPDDSFDYQHKDLGSYMTSFHRKMNLFYPKEELKKRYPKD